MLMLIITFFEKERNVHVTSKALNFPIATQVHLQFSNDDTLTLCYSLNAELLLLLQYNCQSGKKQLSHDC